MHNNLKILFSLCSKTLCDPAEENYLHGVWHNSKQHTRNIL